MKVLKAMFSVEGDNKIMQGSTLEYEGLLWLVAEWLVNPTEGLAKPRRLIALDPFRLQRFPQETAFGHAAANNPIPKGLFEYPIPSQLAGKFPVLDEPDISIPLSEVQTTTH
jgi:hypothetical protein